MTIYSLIIRNCENDIERLNAIEIELNKKYEELNMFNKHHKELIEMNKKYEKDRIYLYGIADIKHNYNSYLLNFNKNNSIKSNSYLSNWI